MTFETSLIFVPPRLIQKYVQTDFSFISEYCGVLLPRWKLARGGTTKIDAKIVYARHKRVARKVYQKDGLRVHPGGCNLRLHQRREWEHKKKERQTNRVCEALPDTLR